MQIILSAKDAKFSDAVREYTGRDVEIGDFTCVEADGDEIAGAQLLADVHRVIAKQSGELED